MAPKVVKWCEETVKKMTCQSTKPGTLHNKCCKTKRSYLTKGMILNGYLDIRTFDNEKDYRVCSHLMDKLKRYKPSNSIGVTSLAQVEVDNFRDDSQVECDDLPTKNLQRKKDEVFVDSILHSAKKYYKPYDKLVTRERTRRLNSLAIELMASCVEKQALIDNGLAYLNKNRDLAVMMNTVLDGIRDVVSRHIGINFDLINDEICPIYNSDEEQEEVGASVEKNDDKSRAWRLSLVLSRQSTMNGYNRLRADLIKEFKLGKNGIPSYYHFNKRRPKTENVDIVPCNKMYNNIQTDDIDVLGSDDIFQYYSNERCNDFDIEVRNTSIIAAKIEGTYVDHLQYIINKYKENIINLGKSIIFLDSYDGAEHASTPKNKISVVSYSTQAFSLETINAGRSTARSLDIFTWLQVAADEKREYIFPVVRDVYHYKKELLLGKYNNIFGNDCKLYFYDLYDGKMLYMFTQHLLYNRQYHPYLLCKCRPGDGVRDPSHECIQIGHDNQVERYDCSKQKWSHFENIFKVKTPPQPYTESDHRNWADKNNYGITHFGVHPEELRRDKIRFDVFHLRCAETRKLMEYLRKYIRVQSFHLQDKLHALLKLFWTEYEVFIWRLNKPFTTFKGTELLLFIMNIPSIISIIKDNLADNEHVRNICERLQLWFSITPFLVVTIITNTEKYKEALKEFENNVKKFYAVGAKTFLTHQVVGDRENFYSHCLRFYLPKIARDSLQEHGVGLGVFTMQGFERRNKESKNTFKRFNNRKGNVLRKNIARLSDVFTNNTNSY